jgi:FkbM family methyltransferase
LTINFIEKLRHEGLAAILARRYRSYRARLMVNNATVGKLVELSGNRIRIEGLKFSVDCPEVNRSHKSILWFGQHELEERVLLRRYLPLDLPVVELGGGLGVISCMANRKLAQPDRHVVVEAIPSVAALLERNRDLNRCQFKVINAALAYGSSTITFRVRPSFVGSRITDELGTEVSVPAVTLGQIADEAGFDSFSLICDIEGAEANLVSHELRLIADRAAFILVEIHPNILGQQGADRVVEEIMGAGFKLAERVGWNWAFVGPKLQ